jgi:hypothetical protein
MELKIPKAYVCHQCPDRVRIRVDSTKGEMSYFSKLEDQFSRHPEIDCIETNALTGSILFKGSLIDVATIADYAQTNELFSLETVKLDSGPWSSGIESGARKADDFLRQFSAGGLDLYGTAFMSLIGLGVFDLLSGSLKLPAWYTAFWYALGVFTMSSAVKASAQKPEES